MNVFGNFSIDIHYTKLKIDETMEYQKYYSGQALEMIEIEKNVVGVELHAQFGDLSMEYTTYDGIAFYEAYEALYSYLCCCIFLVLCLRVTIDLM